MNYANNFPRFLEHGSGETGYVIGYPMFWPVVTTVVGVATPAAPTTATIYAIVVRDATGLTDVIKLSTFDYIFQ